MQDGAALRVTEPNVGRSSGTSSGVPDSRDATTPLDANPPHWHWAEFVDLSGEDVFDVFYLRQQVFVLEQSCLYPDIDARDRVSHHLLGRNLAGELIAYLRVLPPGVVYAEPAIGRVVTAPTARGNGTGRALMNEGLAGVAKRYPSVGVRISAQCYLDRFYRSLGFATVGSPYDEDGIPHQEMLIVP